MTETIQPQSPAVLAKACAPLNELERVLAASGPCPPCPLEHRFTHGADGKVNMYSRTIHMPAGLVCTSKIHRTEHQFVVSKGRLQVWVEGTGWVQIVAPYIGITKAGTRRALAIIEDTIWTTFHPTTCDTVEAWLAESIEPDERLADLQKQQQEANK